MRMEVSVDAFPLKAPFRISNHVWHRIEVVTVRLEEGGFWGWGEGSPVVYHGESARSLADQIESVRAAVEAGVTRAEVQNLLPPGAARCALDCALWHLDARRSGTSVHALAELPAPQAVDSAITISLDTPQAMAAAAASWRAYPLLKVKLGGREDHACIEAVRAAHPGARITVDANTGWDIAALEAIEPVLVRCGVELIEQPMPPGADEALRGRVGPIPIAADESCQTVADVPALVGKYQVASIKLDKTGGLTGAIALLHAAREAGLDLMVSCMVGTSLGMAPAHLIAPFCRVVDLDGPLNAAADREPGLIYENGRIVAWPTSLWG